MPASAHPMAAAPYTAPYAAPYAAPCSVPAVPAHPALYDGPRAAAADFFTLARTGRAQTTLPPFRDGDSVSCPVGVEWMRHDGRWIVPGRTGGLTLTDRTVTGWWHTRHRPGSQFALVHRLTPTETSLITGDCYTSRSRVLSVRDGAFTYAEAVSGPWLRQLAWQAARTRTVSVHLELPTGIVTLHSRLVGDVFFHPDTPGATPALCA
ncbi:hypothetical protein OG413_41525 [Streptomyces sp. NBC_01433]|uniref:hypothetical protein n=1 Tax=Streptomyces sp. NBC_01433 TaxID=2903864 RepID=UPI002258252E|nr:hypothetical protein [Streptomyces sp. NBC_01433]MCX4681685.1 hypothetical protein [Streptomyces sp. NBC_01433]